MPATTVWGYGSVNGAGRKNALLLHNAPSLTIEAQARAPGPGEVDQRPGRRRRQLPAAPAAGRSDRSTGRTRPAATTAATRARRSPTTPGPYTGPVPMVTHVHGAVGVGDESDGYPEAWYLPAARNIPSGYATEGTWYDFFAGKASDRLRRDVGSRVRDLPVPEPQPGLDDLVPRPHPGDDPAQRLCGPGRLLPGPRWTRRRQGRASTAVPADPAVLPGPAPHGGRHVPVEQDLLRDPDRDPGPQLQRGRLAVLPGHARVLRRVSPARTSRDDRRFSPIWNPEFFGNTIMVNGNTWPYQMVEQRRYRFRFLNGCQSRFLILDFNDIPGVEVWQIGNEGGFLAAPVNITADHDNRLLMGLAERADVIVDFTNVPVGNYVLGNVGPDEPFGGGEPGVDFDDRRPRHHRPGHAVPRRAGRRAPTRRRRRSSSCCRRSRRCPGRDRTRPLALIEMMVMGHDGRCPSTARCSASSARCETACRCDQHVDGPGHREPRRRRHRGLGVLQHHRRRPPDARPRGDVRGRQPPGARDRRRRRARDAAAADGDQRPPEPWETGRKDTVIAYPGEVTRVKATFDTPRPVRLALPHRRARGQRDDAAVPHRSGQPGAAETTPGSM